MGTISYFNRIIKRPSLVFNENFLLHPVSSLNTSRQIINNNFDLVESVKRLTNESDENIKKYYQSISKNSKLLDHLNSEFAKLDVPIHMCNIEGHIKTSTLGELLPDSFGPENL